MVSDLTDLNRNLMLSIDIVPVPTDEAVREVENRLLGVETNITNWKREQNQNNNFSAVVPYDMEQQRKESNAYCVICDTAYICSQEADSRNARLLERDGWNYLKCLICSRVPWG